MVTRDEADALAHSLRFFGHIMSGNSRTAGIGGKQCRQHTKQSRFARSVTTDNAKGFACGAGKRNTIYGANDFAAMCKSFRQVLSHNHVSFHCPGILSPDFLRSDTDSTVSTMQSP